MEAERPTLDTVAKAAGVSRMTVSNAYNRPDQLSASTRTRVLQVAADLGYGGPDPAGRTLRRGRSGTIGVVLSDHLSRAFGDPGMVANLHGLATALGEARLALLLLPVTDAADEQLVRDAVVDGFVLVGMAAGSPVVDLVLARRLPVVTSGSLRLPGAPNVGVDDVPAARSMARHLLGLGHRRFGLVTVSTGEGGILGQPPDARPQALHLASGSAAESTRHGGFRRRVQGFLSELEAAGDAVSVDVIGVSSNDRLGGRLAAAALLETDGVEAPTAIFCVTDILALGVLEQAADLGVGVPEDLSVAGFDGVEEAARSRPTLTTVQQDLFGQGQRAAGLLLSAVAGRPTRSVRRPTELVVGESTGPAQRSRPGG